VFTGIIEGLGTVTELTRTTKGARIGVQTPFELTDDVIGDSIAVNGVCLTATSIGTRHFTAVASNETLSLTSLGELKPGHRTNLERALRVGDRLGGHMVQGHVDGRGRFLRRVPSGDATDYHFTAPAELMDAIVTKGSIAIDGISLTVNGVGGTTGNDGTFWVTIIPHTAEMTSLGSKGPGTLINLETDIVGKYIVSLAKRGRLGGTITHSMLKEHGFT
jgi:riboflavin synthase